MRRFRHARRQPTHGAARAAARCALVLVLGIATAALVGCAGGSAEGGETSGPPFELADPMATSPCDPAAFEGTTEAGVDVSHVSSGYVCARGTSEMRLKFQVMLGEDVRTFDLPNDGEATVFPITMGDGDYRFRIMRNTEGDRYVEVCSTTAHVQLESEFAPYVRPNHYCDYDEGSRAVALARELVADAANEGDAVRAIYTYLTDNIVYDTDKAAELETVTGYIPDPDATLAAGSGVCFDYASLAAAMLRSVGIPCRIVTGTVYPQDIYHAWNMVYIDGAWHTAEVSVDPNTWSRIDTTFAAAGSAAETDDDVEYVDRYVY